MTTISLDPVGILPREIMLHILRPMLNTLRNVIRFSLVAKSWRSFVVATIESLPFGVSKDQIDLLKSFKNLKLLPHIPGLTWEKLTENIVAWTNLTKITIPNFFNGRVAKYEAAYEILLKNWVAAAKLPRLKSLEIHQIPHFHRLLQNWILDKSELTNLEIISTVEDTFNVQPLCTLTNITSLTIHFAKTILNVGTLTNLTRLNKLALKSRELIPKLPQLPFVTKFSWHSDNRDDRIPVLSFLENNTQLQSIKLDVRLSSIGSHISVFTNLEHLSIKSLAPTRARATEFFAELCSGKFLHLKTLYFYCHSGVDTTLSTLSFAKLTCLEKLRLENFRMQVGFYQSLENLPRLTDLNLTSFESYNINTTSVIDNVMLYNFIHLTDLSLKGFSVNGDDLLSHLQSMALTKLCFACRKLSSLVKLGALTSLKFLKLDSIVPELEIPSMPNIVQLEIPTKGLQSIKNLRFPNLRMLKIVGNLQVTLQLTETLQCLMNLEVLKFVAGNRVNQLVVKREDFEKLKDAVPFAQIIIKNLSILEEKQKVQTPSAETNTVSNNLNTGHRTQRKSFFQRLFA